MSAKHTITAIKCIGKCRPTDSWLVILDEKKHHQFTSEPVWETLKGNAGTI